MEQPSQDGRLALLLILGFLCSSVLGSVIEPDLAPFLWLVIARPLVALVLALLPMVPRLGRTRPWILMVALLAVVASLLTPASSTACYLTILLVYLVTDTSLDAFYVRNFSQDQWVGSGAVLIVARTLGVVFGLLLSSFFVLVPLWQSRVLQIQLGLLLFFSLFLTELHKTKLEFSDWFKPSLASLSSWPTLVAWARLLAITSLMGLAGGDTLPYVVLSLPRVIGWTNTPLEWLGVLLVGCSLAAFFGTLSQRRLLIGSMSVFLAAVLASSLPAPSKAALLGMQVAGIVAALAALRGTLSETKPVPCVLRAAIFSVSWVASSLLFVWCLDVLSPQIALYFKGFLIGLIGFFVVLAIRDSEDEPQGQLDPFDRKKDEQTRGALHGDKNLDFEAVPEMAQRRKGRRSFRFFLYGLFVHFPITLILILMTAAILAGGWELAESKEEWKQRVDDAWTTMRCEFYMTSLAHRVKEEMLASNRVPKDWPKFIDQNFDMVDGKRLSDNDLWGTPLDFTVTPTDVRIVSAGADRTFNTADDIQRTVLRPAGVKD